MVPWAPDFGGESHKAAHGPVVVIALNGVWGRGLVEKLAFFKHGEEDHAVGQTQELPEVVLIWDQAFGQFPVQDQVGANKALAEDFDGFGYVLGDGIEVSDGGIRGGSTPLLKPAFFRWFAIQMQT